MLCWPYWYLIKYLLYFCIWWLNQELGSADAHSCETAYLSALPADSPDLGGLTLSLPHPHFALATFTLALALQAFHP